MEEMLHQEGKKRKNYFGLLVLLSLYKNDFPWIYELGRELIDILKSDATYDTKKEAIQEFREMIDFTLAHPMFREIHGGRKENMVYIKELPYVIGHYLDSLMVKYVPINGK